VYRKGTIRAKDHLEATAFAITDSLKPLMEKLFSVNKALVTQASSAIPLFHCTFLYYIK
jgi:enoyl-[acyl-carrier protein] reductase/trans-2-enoyl-CoA reductase (NAD+)